MSLEEQEGWKNQEKAYEQGLNVGKKFAQNKAIEVLDRYLGNLKESQHDCSFKIAHKQLLLEIKREINKYDNE
jgi:hypothetical protein